MTEQEAAALLATKPLSSLRRDQDIVAAQIPVAYAQRNMSALERLQDQYDILSAAVYLKTFGH